MTRRDEILKLIVEHFIKTAEPVGSKTLQEVYHLDVSSATIRNEMNALEQDGYLEKTHTSSGRVPSEKGYQYYAEHIRETSVDENAKHGSGKIIGKRCHVCGGSGYSRVHKDLDVNVPAGIISGQQIRVSGKGQRGSNGGPNGDLYVEVQVQPHDVFKREGNDIHARSVPCASALADFLDRRKRDR